MTNIYRKRDFKQKIIGLVPMAGRATRLSPLPFSKELYPVGFGSFGNGHNLRPKVVSHYLLEKMRLAGAIEAYIVIRDSKWDIPAYFRDGKMLDMNLAYLIMDLSHGVPFTIDQAYPFVKDAVIFFGFPDVIFQPNDAYVQLLSRLKKSNADLVLGLFPAPQPHKMDMVDFDTDGNLRGIEVKPKETHLRYTWIIAVWTPSFTHFMHEYVLASIATGKNGQFENKEEEHQELYVGHIIQAALGSDIRIDSVIFPKGSCIDIGTPKDLVEAVNALTCNSK